ncbi:hypothetical protein DFH11DRAFT_510871 [Phellopilus nigrolimitatus]|nr:hypothetical protein DFH11DRAFT_510871 [Phellopilus nigrolimitatus]
MSLKFMLNAERVNRAQQKRVVFSTPCKYSVDISGISSDPRSAHDIFSPSSSAHVRLQILPFLSSRIPFSSFTGHPCCPSMFPRPHQTSRLSGRVLVCNSLTLRATFGSTGFFFCCAVIKCGEGISSDSGMRAGVPWAWKARQDEIIPAAFTDNDVGTRAAKVNVSSMGGIGRGACSYADCAGSVV